MREYLVEQTIAVPADMPADELERLRAAEGARATELAAAGVLVRLWRPADRGDRWANVGLWRAESAAALLAALATLPLDPWITRSIRDLDPHPSDPKGP